MKQKGVFKNKNMSLAIIKLSSKTHLSFIIILETESRIEPSMAKTDDLDLTFLNHNAAFKSKTTWEVVRAYLVFQLCSIQPLVANNEKVRPSFIHGSSKPFI